MRIILSRKGFDSSAGGCASPIFRDSTMMSLPIPEDMSQPGPHGSTMEATSLGSQNGASLPKRFLSPQGNVCLLPEKVHLDPDIRHAMRPLNVRKSCNENLFLFGQNGAPQSHLRSQGVCVGDLFLFFGWFRQGDQTGDDFRFGAGCPDMHVLWGWLQVGKVHDIPFNGPVPVQLAAAHHHPHLSRTDRANNCVYEAAKLLTFDPTIKGAGIFPRYSEEMRLSDPQDPRARRSFWRLPRFFSNVTTSHLNPQRWALNGSHYYGRVPGRGQEFVFDAEGVKTDVALWLVSLFQNAER